MSWLLNTTKQQTGKLETNGQLVLQAATFNKAPSNAGSAAGSEKTINQEMWNQKISSSSELSSVVKKKEKK